MLLYHLGNTWLMADILNEVESFRQKKATFHANLNSPWNLYFLILLICHSIYLFIESTSLFSFKLRGLPLLFNLKPISSIIVFQTPGSAWKLLSAGILFQADFNTLPVQLVLPNVLSWTFISVEWIFQLKRFISFGYSLIWSNFIMYVYTSCYIISTSSLFL